MKKLFVVLLIVTVMALAMVPVLAAEVAAFAAPAGVALDLTPLLQAVIGVIFALLSGFLIPWIRQRTTEEQQKSIRNWVQIAVYAAEKLYNTAGAGPQKLAYVETFLAQHGIALEMDTLTALVNAEIKKMEQGEPIFLAETISE